MKHNTPPNHESLSGAEQQLQVAARNRTASSLRKLGKETGRYSFVGNLLEDGLASVTHGDSQEALTHLVFVGDDSVIGISREVTGLGTPQGVKLTRIRAMLLPFGKHREFGGSRTLLDVSTDILEQPRPGGYKQNWERITIGREELAQVADGSADSTVSGHHLALTVSTNGSFQIDDLKSTNGTHIVGTHDYSELGGGLAPVDQAVLHDVATELQQNTHMWEAQYSDQRVINPYQ